MLIGMATLVALPTVATAQDDTIGGPISLRNQDGSLSVSGQLAGFEDGYYLIEIEGIGVLRIDSQAVECTGDGCPILTPEFGIHGAEAPATRLIPALLAGYADSIGATYAVEETGDPSVRIIRLTDAEGTVRAEAHVHANGSAGAFPALAGKEADIALADRRMTDQDADGITAAGLSDLRDTEHELVIARDGTVLVVHPDNPVRSLSASDIARIYAGEIRNWSELGGEDLPVRANSLARGSRIRDGIVTGFLDPNGLEEGGDSLVWPSEEELAASVASDPGAIGYLGRSAALGHPLKMLALREPCGLVSPPTAFRIKTDGYRLARPLYAYKRPGRIHPEAQAFLEWVLSDDAQTHIKRAGYIDGSLERMRLEDMGIALIHTAAVEPDFNGLQYAGMMRDLRDADRLSISFRFLAGSTTLDVDSIRNLEALAARLEAGQFAGNEILLVGFADSIGDRGRNTQLAARRAQVVRDNLIASLAPDTADGLRMLPLSFGELLPLSCNTDEVGRERNRRVEVWLRRPDLR